MHQFSILSLKPHHEDLLALKHRHAFLQLELRTIQLNRAVISFE